MSLKLSKKELQANGGITLIALVITIIVLLILAGVAIATLTGDNGLLQKATNSKGETIKAEGLERVKVAIFASLDNDGKIDTEQLAKNLSEIEGIKDASDASVTSSTNIILPALFKLNGYEYKIKSDGSANPKKPGAIEAADIKNAPTTYYGKYVTNYNSLSDAGIKASEGQKWQVFLADDTNIYLIASSVIHKDYKPLNYNNNGNYMMYFRNILSLYNTSTAGNPSVASLLGKLSKQEQYHEWLSKATLQNYDNQKAVLSMLDTEKWNEYKDSENNTRGFKNVTYASYVLGGPTVEMFCESYNTTHGGLDVIPKPKDDNSNAYYKFGYKVKKGDLLDNYTTSNLKASTQTELVSGINNMHFKSNYWLASPSAYYSDYVMYVSSYGQVDRNDYFNETVSFRPLVCLRSDVHLIEKTNGTTTTYELELD